MNALFRVAPFYAEPPDEADRPRHIGESVQAQTEDTKASRQQAGRNRPRACNQTPGNGEVREPECPPQERAPGRIQITVGGTHYRTLILSTFQGGSQPSTANNF